MSKINTVLNGVSLEVKKAILEGKLERWKNTLYDLKVDAEIGEAIGDSNMKNTATEKMKDTLKAIESLENKLASL